jgi:hypothetical protein
MKFPEIITRLPEAALPFPSSVIKTSVIQPENGQLIFFDVQVLGRGGGLHVGRMYAAPPHQTNVRFRGIADIAGFWPGTVCPLTTQSGHWCPPVC